MKLKNYSIPIVAILILSVFIVSCKDEWDNHYSTKALNKSSLNLTQYIKSRKDLSIFYTMLTKTGYDSILSRSETYTVWAPTDSALKDVNLSDSLAVIRIVKNHITRFSYPSSSIGGTSRTILMLNDKLLPFAKAGAGFTFGSKTVTEPDWAFVNGIVHVLKEYTPYKRNLWEFITETNELDSIRKYINSLSYMTLDKDKSVFSSGILVEAVYKKANYVYTNLAALEAEDSTYTAILPNNAAWSEAYNRILPFYKTRDTEGGVASQIDTTKKVLIHDLFFRGKNTYPYAVDTLQSTGLNYFLHPNRLFANADKYELSNGYGFVTDKLKNDSTESWYKPIRIEAEWSVFGRITPFYNALSIYSIGTKFDISGHYYTSLVDISTSGSSLLSASFPILGYLSAKYNIYCVFVPTIISDTADTRPYKVRFYLNYVNAAGTTISKAIVDGNNAIQPPSPTKTSYTFTTDPMKIDKMLVVRNFQFPYRFVAPKNIADLSKAINLTVTVQNATAKTVVEQLSYNRNIKIDYIILEPVQ